MKMEVLKEFVSKLFIMGIAKVFESHISENSEMKTDRRASCKPLKKKYPITQTKGNAEGFFVVNAIVHQVKAWLRSVCS